MPNSKRVTFERWRACDRCGFDYPLSQLKRDYTGALVCERDYFNKGFKENYADMDIPLEGESRLEEDVI